LKSPKSFFFLDFFFFSGVVFVVLSIEAIDGVLVAGKLLPIIPSELDGPF